MAKFLDNLTTSLSQQFLSENPNAGKSLDDVVDGNYVRYGKLGEFASKFDQSAQRKYLEQGYLRKDPSNIDSKQFELLMQQPTATVLVKKRMYNSIGDNYRLDLMDQEERMYYKAMGFLFQNKCKQISLLEKLSKIERVSTTLGSVDEQLMSLLFSLTAEIPNLFGGLTTEQSVLEESNNFTSGVQVTAEVGSFAKTVDRIRRIYAFNKSAKNTSWITDSTNIFRSQLGGGTGVIEITNFTSFSTTTTLSVNSPGRFNLSISDPYEAMVITDFDIERAIADAINIYKKGAFGLIFESVDELVVSLTNRLNRIRAERGASPISFKVNPDTLIGRRVRAIIDRTGLEIEFEFKPGLLGGDVELSDIYLLNGLPGYDGLNPEKKKYLNLDSDPKNIKKHEAKYSELSTFKDLISAIYNKLSLDRNSKNELQQTNVKTNYVRKKLRFNFLGKTILQPMDSVHFYINSRSKYDSKLLGGLKSMFNGLNALQSISNAFTDIIKQKDALFNPNSLGPLVERSVFVGPEFPNFLWNMIRPQFVNEKEGVHVFAGVIDNASSSWSGGNFSVNVSGSDNSYYFSLGKVNDKPGADTWNGIIYNPLTPFESKFDSVVTNYDNKIPVLLKQNQILLSNKFKEGALVKSKAGALAGKPLTTRNYAQDKTVDPVTGRFTRTFYAPDGLVYRWKEGIGAFIQRANSLNINSPDQVGVQNLNKDPFAGQDVMNVISLLITGSPYNFASYWKTVANFNGQSSDPHSKENPAGSYHNYINNSLKKRNSLWGNFIPFKNLVMDDAAFARAQQSLVEITKKNSEIEAKLKELEQIETKAYALNMHAFSNETIQKIKQGLNPALLSETEQASIKLIKEINDLLAELKKQDQSFLVQSGSDVSFDFDEFLYKGSNSAKTADAAARRMLRRQVNFLTRRMSYNVRANEDKNLFIVDDSYDKDYDIAAFNSGLENGLGLYSNSNLDIKGKISVVADLLNLEVFCDTQGHIRARPPQYNRMPSSVFNKMMYQKQALGIQVFPEFLNDIFSNQLKTLREYLEIIEDEIRLDCAVLGYKDDAENLAFINTSGALNGSGIEFQFVSSDEGRIIDLPLLQNQALPGKEGNEYLKVQSQASNIKDVFSSAQKYAFILNKIGNASQNRINNPTNPYNIVASTDFSNNLYINQLISRIETKSGQRVNNFSKDIKPPFSFQNNSGDIDIFKVTEDLSEKISKRQKLIKLFYSALKTSQEYKSLDNDSSTANKLLNFGVHGNKDIPQVFEHMIEDESYDDLGPNSGSRYIIKNAQITRYDIREQPPPFTYVEVHGTLINLAPEAVTAELNNAFPEGGNGQITGAAIDYDLWKNYGFRGTSPINVPFLSDPETQCAPYATSILSRARKQILSCNMSIIGNEYMQPGEVVFFENKGLLFYVSQVSHNFSSLSSFRTELTLTYGHAPGEYIPTTLDVIGKALYNNKEVGEYKVRKDSNSFSEYPYGPIIRDPNANNTFGNNSADPKSGGGGTFGPANAVVFNNIINNVAYFLYSNGSFGNNLTAILELRIYYDSKLGPINSDLRKFADKIKEMFANPSILQQAKASNGATESTSPTPLISKYVQIKEVDLSADDDHRSPSDKAHSAVRDIISTSSGISLSNLNPSSSLNSDEEVPPPFDEPDSEAGEDGKKEESTGATKVNDNVIKKERDKIRIGLFGHIVDCWVKFESSEPNSQANGG